MERMPNLDRKLIFSEMRPAQIDGLWVYMSRGIEDTYRRWQGRVEWVPNSFFEAIKKDRAKASFIYDDGNRIGFIIYRIFWQEFSNLKYLHIWFAYLYPEYRHRLNNIIPDCMEYLVKTAKYYQCKFIEMDTLRLGWTKLLKEFGLKPNRVIYRKEL